MSTEISLLRALADDGEMIAPDRRFTTCSVNPEKFQEARKLL